MWNQSGTVFELVVVTFLGIANKCKAPPFWRVSNVAVNPFDVSEHLGPWGRKNGYVMLCLNSWPIHPHLSGLFCSWGNWWLTHIYQWTLLGKPAFRAFKAVLSDSGAESPNPAAPWVTWVDRFEKVQLWETANKKLQEIPASQMDQKRTHPKFDFPIWCPLPGFLFGALRDSIPRIGWKETVQDSCKFHRGKQTMGIVVQFLLPPALDESWVWLKNPHSASFFKEVSWTSRQ